MKKHFSFFLIMILSIAVLAGSQGFTIGKMICLSSGKVTMSMSEPVDCCAKKDHEKDVLKNKCCDLKASTYKLSSFNLGLEKQLLVPHMAVLAYSPSIAFSSDLFSDVVLPDTKAPPLLYSDIHSFLSVFRI